MGIYLHVPFCRNKCFYCGFYSTASLGMKEAYIEALGREMELRKDYLSDREIQTLYLGGGTPSYLNESELELIVNKIHKIWNLSHKTECSIEMNPEDASPDKLRTIRQLGFNRLTIGVQSFNEGILKRINRTHDSRQAIVAVEKAVKAGFDNIGIDLIIGLPGSTEMDIKKDLNIVKELNINHLSIYILSIDSNSVFERLSEKGKFSPQEDDVLAGQYLMMSDYLKNMGYEHYEISNFAKDSKYSRHNTAYWQQKPYLGLGPSAHSFDINSRQWNISNLKSYISGLNDHHLIFEKEILNHKDKYNEYLMTNFRTMWGIDSDYLLQTYPEWWNLAKKKIECYCEKGLMVGMSGKIRMTERGWLVSDGIFSELFM